MDFRDRRVQMLTATWTPQLGAHVVSSDLPHQWLIALDRLGHDLHVRQYGAYIEHIDWEARYDPVGGAVWLQSSITVSGRGPDGMGGNGTGAQIDDDVETALVSMADLVQTEIAEAHTAWPWGDQGGFMSPLLVDDVAVWRDRDGQSTRIGDLTERYKQQ